MALKEFSGDLIQEPRLKEFSGELDAPASQGNSYTNAYKALWGKLVPNGNDLRDVAAAALKIGPTALKGVGDIAQLVTAGGYGSGVSNAMTEGMQAIDDVIGSPELRAQKQNVNAVLNDPNKGIGDLASTVIENPRAAVDAGVSTIGSLFLPAGAAKAVTMIPKVANSGKAATAAAIGAGGAMNAADTFTSIDSPDLADKYSGAALSGLTSLGVGALTGGGAEGLIAKKIANDPSIRQAASNVFARLFGQPLKTMGKEGLQEAGEASGNYLGEIVGDGKEFNANQLGKRAAYEGALGAILGGGVGAATNTGGQPPGITIIGNPAPVNANAVSNVASMIANSATMDSKLKPAPADIELTETAQQQQDQPVDLNAQPQQAPVVSPLAPEVSDDKIIQNRNRATPSSIAQMTAISAAPDYNRLSFSRDFANGAPVVSGGIIPAEQLGASDVAVASDGRRIPVQYAVVDASELLPSNQADGTENAAFYDGTIDAVRAIAGNGRIAGLQAAYGKNTAGNYRAELEADTLHGVDPQVIAGMANPVLVRVMPQESVTADIGDVSNTVGNLELSPVEQANNDVQRVNLEALSFAEDGSVTPQAVRQFVQAMPQAEQGSLLDTNGQPTKQAVDRLNAAIFAKAYNNDKLIRLYAQAQDAEARIVLSALAQVAPKMARLEGAGQMDIRQAVTDAAEIAVNARRNGLSITRAAQQVDITADPNVVEVLTLFAANVRSSKAVAEALGRAADFAYSEAIKPAEDMFGEVPKASRQEVFNQLRNADEPTGTQDLPNAQGASGVPQDPARATVFQGGQGDANGAGAGGSVNDTTARQDAADYGLDSYTNRDIVERLDRIEKAQKEAEARARAEEAKRQADLERDTFGLTGSESETDRLEAQGQGRLFQPTAGYKTNPEALAAIDRAYGGRPAYDAAKASGKTELSYDDWLLVRTPAFREVFGNWEALRAQKKLDAMTPIKINVPDVWRGLDIKTLRSKVEAELLAIAESGVPLRNNEIGDVAIAKRGIGKAMSASADPAKLLVLGDIRNAFESSILASTSLSDQAKPNVVGYEKLLANVEIDGHDLIALFTIERLADGRQFYNSVTLEGNEKTPAASPRDTPEQVGERATLANTGVSGFIRRQLDRVNQASINGEINPRTGEPANPGAVNIAVREYSSQYGRQLDFFLDYGPDQSQAGAAGEAAQREAVSAVDDLRSSGSVLGKALSSAYATGQRVTLVGQRVDSAEDLATLAQVYRDPRFETFRLIFVNDAGRVVSQIGLTSRLPASTQAIIGDDADAYLKDVSAIAKSRGATRFWMLHNHPSGIAKPSNADINLTRYFSEKMPGLSNNGHVVIDTNEYSEINAFGDHFTNQKDFGAINPMTAGEFTGFQIKGADSVMELSKRLNVDDGAVTLIAVSAQMRVLRISTIPTSMVSESDAANHRTMLKEALASKGMFIFAVSRDMAVLEKVGKFAMDGVHIANDGSVTTLNLKGKGGELDLFPDSRRTRLSPDSSNEFDYLRKAPTEQEYVAARDSQAGETGAQYEDGLSETKSTNRAIDAADLLRLRREAAGIEDPERGITFQITEDGQAIVRGPADTRVPDRFARFAEANGLTLSVRRNQYPKGQTRPMPLAYRESGALYFGENYGEETKPGFKTFIDRTGKSVFEEPQQYGAGTRTDTTGLNGEGDTARSAAVVDSLTDPQAEMNVPPAGKRFDPIRIGDWVKTERGATGRRQYVAGRKLWDRAAGYANEYLGKLKLADTKPGAFKEMLRQFNVDKTKASQQAKRIAETGMDLTPEQRAMLSDLIEKQSALGDVPPQEIVDLAATMTAALDVQARELVDLGMLSEDRLVKNYLPRLYKNGLAGMLTNPTLMRSWFAKARMRIRGDRLKSRGMFTELPVAQVEQAKKLGWKVSGMMDGAPLPDDLLKGLETDNIPGKYADAKIVMWRDYTQAEREQMGEIRDGILRYALGYVETQKDIAIGRLFKAIASDSNLAKDHNPGGWVKVPDQEIKGAPGTKAYGVLSGMWVEPQVADSLKRNTQPKGVLMAAYDKALSFWKEGKTVWNPVAHGNNVVSNLFTIHFAGINPTNPKAWRETLREYRIKGKYYNEALDNGLFGNEWANQEIQDLLMPDFADMASLEDVAASRVSKVIDLAKKAGKPVSWYRKKMQKAYEFEDQFFKLMLYIDRRKAGMDPQEAITDAERYVFNYADMPEGVELIKRTASPFFAYTYKAIPMVLHTAMTRPDRMLAPIALLGGANWLAYMILGADEEEERKAMPEYMKGRTFIGTQKAIRLPFNIDDRPAFLDMSRRVPLGDLFDINNQTGGMPIPAPFMPSHPVLSMLQAVVYNQDTFTGRDLVKKSDTGWEAAQARAGYMVRQFMPNAPFVPGSYNFNKLADATAYAFDTEIGPYTGYTKAGDPVRMATVLPDVMTGTKIRSFDPQRGLAYQAGDLDKEEREIRANIRSAGKNKAMTEEARQRYIEGQQEKLRRLGERRAELNE